MAKFQHCGFANKMIQTHAAKTSHLCLFPLCQVRAGSSVWHVTAAPASGSFSLKLQPIHFILQHFLFFLFFIFALLIFGTFRPSCMCHLSVLASYTASASFTSADAAGSVRQKLLLVCARWQFSTHKHTFTINNKSYAYLWNHKYVVWDG